jgi:hypothetical protein
MAVCIAAAPQLVSQHSAEITADWEETTGNRWLVPIGGGIRKVFGKQSYDWTALFCVNAVRPEVRRHQNGS